MKAYLALLTFALVAACGSFGPHPPGSGSNDCLVDECGGPIRTAASYALPCTEERGRDACADAATPEAERAAKEQGDLECRTPERVCSCEKKGAFEVYLVELDLTFQTPPHRGVPPFCIAVCKVSFEGRCREFI